MFATKLARMAAGGALAGWLTARAVTVVALEAEPEPPRHSTADDSQWWRRRPAGTRRPSASRSTAGAAVGAQPRTPEKALPSGIRVAVVGDSISYGVDASAPRNPTPVRIAEALGLIAQASGKQVKPEAVPEDGRPTVATVHEVERLWELTEMDLFLKGGNDPSGVHHGIDIAREGNFVGVAGASIPLKQKLAVMAQRFDVSLHWGWPWPAAEPMPPQLPTTPASHLQQLLGPEVTVGNFAVSGTTLLARGHNPYTQRAAFAQSLAFQPHVVIINLGFNDANDWNWRLRRNEFCGDYLNMIDHFAALPTKPEIYICIPTVPRDDAPHTAEVQQIRREVGGLDSSINAVAALRDITVVDLEYALTSADYAPDLCHPNETGAKHIAVSLLATIKSKSEVLNPQP